MDTINGPKALLQAVRYFSDPDTSQNFFVKLRWPNGVVCPTCGSDAVKYMEKYRRWLCRSKHPRRQFSAKVGTIFEDSPIPLEKWLPAVWMIANCKNGISSYELGRALDVTQKTAWFMLHRIRLAMQDDWNGTLRGIVEADETYIGGAARFMHADRRQRVLGNRKTSTVGKAIVMGILERGLKSRVRATVIAKVDRGTVHGMVRGNVEPGSMLMTDAGRSYIGLRDGFVHQFVDHVNEYVRGAVHTNGIENFWTLLKRAIRGTYVNVEPFHLHRYVEEQAFRFNERFGKDADRFIAALRSVAGRRLTFKALTAAEA